MLILKIVGMAFVAMFIIVIIRKSGSNIGTLFELVAGA